VAEILMRVAAAVDRNLPAILQETMWLAVQELREKISFNIHNSKISRCPNNVLRIIIHIFVKP
jgi:hypothetical protein